MSNEDTIRPQAETNRLAAMEKLRLDAEKSFAEALGNVAILKELPSVLFNMDFYHLLRLKYNVTLSLGADSFESAVCILSTLDLLPLARVNFDGLMQIVPEERAQEPLDESPAECHNSVLGPVASRIVCYVTHLDGQAFDSQTLEAWIKTKDGTLCCISVRLPYASGSPVLLDVSKDGSFLPVHCNDKSAALWPVFERCAEPAEGEPTFYVGYKRAEADHV